jgi:hypothetical protein
MLPPLITSRRPLSSSCAALRARWAFLAVALVFAGCQIARQHVVTRPSRHSIRSDQLLVLSDFKLAKDHPLIADLKALRQQEEAALELSFDAQTVVVYLFSDQLTYRQYLDATYPGLPDRRAYFVGTPKELAVYTFWGDRIQEDLRHEYTHGLLHSALKEVPLWLDEGLAEYFEVIGPNPGTVNSDYATRLSSALANGWRPDLERLERIEEFPQMQRFDYQESWAWVHYMLHSSPDTKQVLLSYLHDLRTNANPELISARLKREIPNHGERMTAWVATLQTTRGIAAAQQGTGSRE